MEKKLNCVLHGDLYTGAAVYYVSMPGTKMCLCLIEPCHIRSKYY